MPQSLITTGLITTGIVFTFVATIAVVVRIYVSRKAQPQAGLTSDHWLIIAALAFCYGSTIETICAAAIAGVNYTDLDQLTATSFFFKIVWIEAFLTQPASALVKISIVEFYKRIFVGKYFRWACNIQTTLISMWLISTLFAQLFTAWPITSAWDPTVNHLVIDSAAFDLYVFGTCIVLDFITLCLPLPVIAGLHMSSQRKWKVACIFWLGIFCVISSAIRFWYAYKGIHPSLTPYKNLVGVSTWSRIEPAASIIAACLPLYGPLLSKGRFLHSLVRSAMGMFSIRTSDSKKSSRHGGKNANNRSDRSSDGAALNHDNWHQLHDVENSKAFSGGEGTSIKDLNDHGTNTTEDARNFTTRYERELANGT